MNSLTKCIAKRAYCDHKSYFYFSSDVAYF